MSAKLLALIGASGGGLVTVKRPHSILWKSHM
jgi:hypothetical protein